MILEDSQTIAAEPAVVVSFLEDMDQHYLDWHPDHVSFDWLDGTHREHFYLEERIGGWRVRMPMRIDRSVDLHHAMV